MGRWMLHKMNNQIKINGVNLYLGFAVAKRRALESKVR